MVGDRTGFAQSVALVIGLASALNSPAAAISLDELHDAFPGADRVGPVEGHPPAAPVYRGDQLAGYVFYTDATVPTAGYSGRPINIIVGLDLGGTITGAHLLEHNEPILNIGIEEERLQSFIDEHQGLRIDDPEVAAAAMRGGATVDTISGATISSLVMNDNIIMAARLVARSRDLLEGPAAGTLDFDFYEPATWSELVDDGSIVHQRIEGTASGTEPAPVLSDLHVTLANLPRIGRNLLGATQFTAVTSGLEPGDGLILVAADGLYSFKGTAYVRRGEFDRIHVLQDGREYKLRQENHIGLTALAPDAPKFREIGLFTVPAAEEFEIGQPWSLQLLLDTPLAREGQDSAEVRYQLPRKYFADEATAEQVAVQSPAAIAGEAANAADGSADASGRAQAGRREQAAQLQMLESGMKIFLIGLIAAAIAMVGVLAVLQRLR
jgi:NosR/NirI family transcriptional regulator, nitrous oxide reductase regulator